MNRVAKSSLNKSGQRSIVAVSVVVLYSCDGKKKQAVGVVSNVSIP